MSSGFILSFTSSFSSTVGALFPSWHLDNEIIDRNNIMNMKFFFKILLKIKINYEHKFNI